MTVADCLKEGNALVVARRSEIRRLLLELAGASVRVRPGVTWFCPPELLPALDPPPHQLVSAFALSWSAGAFWARRSGRRPLIVTPPEAEVLGLGLHLTWSQGTTVVFEGEDPQTAFCRFAEQAYVGLAACDRERAALYALPRTCWYADGNFLLHARARV